MLKKQSSIFIKGFVDPLSLIGVVFLLVATIIGVTVVTNKGITLNPNKMAESVYCVPNGTCLEPGGDPCCGDDKFDLSCPVTETRCGTATPKPTPTPTPNCTGKDGIIAQGSAPCCNGLERADCVAAGSFSYCYCRVKGSPTPTPSTRTCVVRNCLGTSCIAKTTTVPYSQACLPSNCANNANCASNTAICSGDKPVGSKVCNNAGGYNYCQTDGHWYSSKCPTGTICSSGECVNTASINCEGKPVGTKVCNTSGGYNYCSTDGHWYSEKCPTSTTCTGSTGQCLAQVLKEVGDKCSADSECKSGNCYAGNQVLGGSPFDSTKTCHVNSIAVMDKLERDVSTGVAIGIPIVGATVLTGGVLIPEIAALAGGAGGLAAVPLATSVVLSNYLSSLPSWVTPTMTFAGTLPAVYSTAKCQLGLCTPEEYEQAQMAAFLTGFGIQQMYEQQMIQNIAAQNIKTPTSTITLYHGSQSELGPILDDGLHGFVGSPTLSDDIMQTPIDFASGKGFSAMQSSAKRGLGGYVLEVEIPSNLVIPDEVLEYGPGISETYYSLSQNNPLRPGATNSNQVTLIPEYISNIYPVTPTGELGAAIPQSQWSSFATEVHSNIEQATLLHMKAMFPDASNEFILQLVGGY